MSRGARDLLRLEGFGAVYYQRRSGATLLFPEPVASLLAAARERSIVEAFAAGAGPAPLGDLAFARQVAALKGDGVLDDGYRVDARLVDGRPRRATLSAPLVTHVQLTQACNLTCSHCYVPVTPEAHPDELGTDQVIRLLEELGAIGCPVVVLAGGEPLRRPDLFEILDALEGADVDATLCTNATLVDADKARRMARTALRAVNVSLDGPDAATHDAIRGQGQLSRALRGARHLLEAGIPEVKLRVTVTRATVDRLLDFAPLARDLGAHAIVFKPFDQVGVASDGHALAIDRGRWDQAALAARERWPADAPTAVWSDGMPTRPPAFAPLIPTFGCVGGTTSATVLPDGRVVACGVFKAPDDWTLHERSFTECWLGSGSIARWRALEGNPQCRTCEHLEVCGGGCRARATGAGRGFLEPDPFALCSLYSPRADADARGPGAEAAASASAEAGAAGGSRPPRPAAPSALRRLPMVG